MARQGRQRTVRDRFNRDGVTVKCECGKRFAYLWVSDGGNGVRRQRGCVDGAWFIEPAHSWATPLPLQRLDGYDERRRVTARFSDRLRGSGSSGIKDLTHEDWFSVRCTRCGRDNQGREHQLVTLIQSALARGAKTVTFSQAMLRTVREGETEGRQAQSGYTWP